MPVSLPHVRALDGIRGAAIAGVLLFHGDLELWGRAFLPGGYLGVDLFFVLSGFLITSLLLKESRAVGHIGLGAFWARRARRLLPALFLMLFAVGIYAAVFGEPTELGRIRSDSFATLGYVANWSFVMRGFDYWALFTAPSPLAHTWSIAIEEQFYVLWPLVLVVLLWFAGRRGSDARQRITPIVLGVCIAGAAVSAALMIRLYESNGDIGRVYYGTDTRAQSILIGATLGALLALCGPVRKKSARKLLEVAGIVGVVVIAVAWWRLEGTSPHLYHGGLLLSALAGAIVIAAAVHPDQGPLAKALAVRPLVALGLISYGLYLWHWPIYVWLNGDRVGFDGWPLLAVRIAVTLVAATLSYVFVEKPIRYGAFKASTLAWLTPVAAALLIVVTIASTADAVPALATGDHREPNEAADAADRAPDKTRLMLVGNSVGAFLAQEGFAQLPTKDAPTLLDATQVACVFPTTSRVRIPSEPTGVVLPDCRTDWATAVEQFNPEVVLAAFNDVGTFAFNYEGKWIEPCSPEFAAFYAAALDEAVATLGARGARVVATTSAYQLTEYDGPAVRRQAECGNSLLRSYAKTHLGLELIDLAVLVCPTINRCRERLDGIELREDGVHYKSDGAVYISKWMMAQLDLPEVSKGAR